MREGTESSVLVRALADQTVSGSNPQFPIWGCGVVTRETGS